MTPDNDMSIASTNKTRPAAPKPPTPAQQRAEAYERMLAARRAKALVASRLRSPLTSFERKVRQIEAIIRKARNNG